MDSPASMRTSWYPPMSASSPVSTTSQVKYSSAEAVPLFANRASIGMDCPMDLIEAPLAISSDSHSTYGVLESSTVFCAQLKATGPPP